MENVAGRQVCAGVFTDVCRAVWNTVMPIRVRSYVGLRRCGKRHKMLQNKITCYGKRESSENPDVDSQWS